MKQILSPSEMRKMVSISDTLSSFGVGKNEPDPRNKVELLPDGNTVITTSEELSLKMLGVIDKWLPVVLSQAKALMGSLELAFGDYDEATKVPKAKANLKDLDLPINKSVTD